MTLIFLISICALRWIVAKDVVQCTEKLFIFSACKCAKLWKKERLQRFGREPTYRLFIYLIILLFNNNCLKFPSGGVATVADTHSTSSGTSDMSDYVETLSLCSSHSSSDTPVAMRWVPAQPPLGPAPALSRGLLQRARRHEPAAPALGPRVPARAARAPAPPAAPARSAAAPLPAALTPRRRRRLCWTSNLNVGGMRRLCTA